MSHESVAARMARILEAGPSPDDIRRWAGVLAERSRSLVESASGGDVDAVTEDLAALVPLIRQIARAVGHKDLYRALGPAATEASRL